MARRVIYGPAPVLYGSTAGTACEGDDARLEDARPPTAHASTHATGGTDALTPAAIGAAAVSSATPAALGAASAGTSPDASRADHVHALPSAADVGAAATSHTHAAADITDLASVGTTRLAITGDTTLSGTGDLLGAVTSLASSLTVTLPAASGRAGQRVTLLDETGTVTTALARIVPPGSDTLRYPGGSDAVAALLCWIPRASVALVSDGVSAWRVEQSTGWYIDPRSISGLKLWLDARRGITLNGTTVSAWADLSGNGLNATQATAAQQPGYRAAALGGLPGVVYDGANDVLSTPAAYTSTGGALSTLALVTRDWAETVASSGGNDQQVWALTGSNVALTIYEEAAFADWQAGDWLIAGAGYTTSASRVVVPRQRNLGSSAMLFGGRISSTLAEGWVDGARVAYQRTTLPGAVATHTNAIAAVGNGYLVGVLHDTLVFDAAVSDSNWALLQQAIMRTWGMR